MKLRPDFAGPRGDYQLDMSDPTVESRKKFILRVVVLTVVVVMVNSYVLREGISYRDIIVGLAGLAGGIIFFGGERGIRFGFMLWTLSMALGYRTIGVTHALRIHPSEILLWVLFVCILAKWELISKSRFSLAWWLWLFIPFWGLGWWPIVAGDAPWDKMLNEFRNFLMFIPVLIVTAVVLDRKKYWRTLLTGFYLAATWIALMGVIEYWFPDVSKIFPAFIRAAKPEATADGFMRAQFSFWGGAEATFICLLALPAGFVLVNWWTRLYSRLAIVFAAVLQLLAIYIGGYRSIWFIVLVQVVLALMLRLKKHGVAIALLCLVVGVGGFQYIPNTTERVNSGIAALRGAPIDHSARDRRTRALGAFDQAVESPLGKGWGSSGWVHSDFLQVAANLGIIPGLIFVGGFLYTLFRLGRRLPKVKTGVEADLALCLFLSLIGVGGVLTFQGVQVLSQLILPVWFVWALVEVWLRQTSDVRDRTYSYARAHLYPAANFQ